ncbi:tRNA lysidine(34) synthetase TilS [Salinicoccus albus]|uniref:tRNA lysidine(34) synthetase TilS n=1 Tax=Salinicoccus albus TaxID=418756 RepID=UPI00035C6D26|nr:tRNA lysidine(34) synthetase TilS [Salinicoccus albus]
MELWKSWTKDDTIALAISGGMDSMVLYHLLRTAYQGTYRKLILLHVNHNQRAASEDEAEYIAQMAQRNGLIHEITRLGIPKEKFTQARAREERYLFFDKMMTRHSAAVLLTAHHLDDQYESVLHQLLSGRYIPGEMSIPADRSGPGYLISRPLINVQREDIQAYARKHQVVCFEDETNSETEYTRNYIRHNILPPIRHSGNLHESQLLNLARDLSEIDGMLKEESAAFLSSEDESASREAFNKKRRISRFYILNDWFLACGEHPRRRYIEEMIDVISQKTAQVSFVIGRHQLMVAYDRLQVLPKNNEFMTYLEIHRNGVYHFNDYRIEVNLDAQDMPLKVRTRQDGDKMRIPNTGTKNLSRILIDRKIPRLEREFIPVVIDNSQQIIALGTIYNIIKSCRRNSGLLITKEQVNDDS